MTFDSKYKPILIKEHQPWILYLIALVHVTWAISIREDSQVSSLFVLIGLDFLTRMGLDGIQLSAFLYTISAFAFVGLLFEKHIGRWRAFLLLLPQYLVLIFAFLSDAMIFITREVHCTTSSSSNCINGYQHVDIWIIMAVLCIFMYAALLHTAAILERYIFRWYQPSDFGIQEFDNVSSGG